MHRFAPHFQVKIIDSELALIEGDSESFLFSDPGSVALIRKLGVEDALENELIPVLGKEFSELALWSVFEQLRARKVLLRDSEFRARVDAFDNHEWREMLQLPSAPSFFVVEDLFAATVSSWPSDCILFLPFGERAVVGPLTKGNNDEWTSEAGICRVCLLKALRSQQTRAAWIQGRSSELVRKKSVQASPKRLQEIELLLRPFSENKITGNDESGLYSVDPKSRQVEFHSCSRLSEHRCLCARAVPQKRVGRNEGKTDLALHPTSLQSQETGYRLFSPREVFERCCHLVDDQLGPIAFLRKQARRQEKLPPVYLSGFRLVPRSGEQNNERLKAQLKNGRDPFLQICAGKGWTEAQSKMSALGEALERYASLFSDDLNLVVASQHELQTNGLADGEGFLAPECLHFYHAKESQEFNFPEVARQARHWIEGYEYSTKKPVLAPVAQFYGNLPDGLQTNRCRYSSNGCAAGSTIDEAVLQGLLEVIERDALAIWWYNRLSCPGIELEQVSFSDDLGHQIESLRSCFAKAGWKTWALDLRFDLNLPVVASVAYHPELKRYAFGFGCHLDPALAIARAYCELNQLVDDLEKPRAFPWDGISDQEHKFLHPVSQEPLDGKKGRRATSHHEAFGRVSFGVPKDLREAIATLVATIEEKDQKVFVFDKTQSKRNAHLPLKVVHVCVPGFRHPWPSFGPGRLYDVPVQLGYIEKPLDPEQLNPVPLLI